MRQFKCNLHFNYCSFLFQNDFYCCPMFQNLFKIFHITILDMDYSTGRDDNRFALLGCEILEFEQNPNERLTSVHLHFGIFSSPDPDLSHQSAHYWEVEKICIRKW